MASGRTAEERGTGKRTRTRVAFAQAHSRHDDNNNNNNNNDHHHDNDEDQQHRRTLARAQANSRRLANLGYDVTDEIRALQQFQLDHELEKTGELDDATLAKIEEVHRS